MKFFQVLLLIFSIVFTSCGDGDDGKAYLSLVWSDISAADTIFVSLDSGFPDGESVSQIMKRGEIVCNVIAYTSNFEDLKGVEYRVYPGTFCYGTVQAGVVSYRTIDITIEKGEKQKDWHLSKGDDGSSRYYSVSLDNYTFVP